MPEPQADSTRRSRASVGLVTRAARRAGRLSAVAATGRGRLRLGAVGAAHVTVVPFATPYVLSGPVARNLYDDCIKASADPAGEAETFNGPFRVRCCSRGPGWRLCYGFVTWLD